MVGSSQCHSTSKPKSRSSSRCPTPSRLSSLHTTPTSKSPSSASSSKTSGQSHLPPVTSSTTLLSQIYTSVLLSQTSWSNLIRLSMTIRKSNTSRWRSVILCLLTTLSVPTCLHPKQCQFSLSTLRSNREILVGWWQRTESSKMLHLGF